MADAHNSTKYSVNSRISALQNAVTELQNENKNLRVHLAGELKTAISDAKNVIQGSIRVPVDGKDGVDGTQGPQGERGPAGSVLFIGPDEVQAQVQILRQALVKWQSALQLAYSQNAGTKHRGLQAAINGVLKQIEKNAAQ